MEEHEDEDDMLNCPDCKLQTLQHQQSYSSEINTSTEFHNEANNRESTGNVPKRSKNLVDHTFCSGQHNQSNFDLSLRDYNSTSCLFKSTIPEYNSSVSTSTSTNSSATASQSVITVPSGPLSDILPSSGTCVTPIPLEHCEMAGYCPTCAVLDLPSNDKFYRSGMSRPVFPPLFYGQGPPPTPMTGFTPLPECSPWNSGNSTDYPNYSYSQFQQHQQPSTSATTTAVSNSSDYFTNTTVLPGIQSPIGISQPSSFSSCLFDNKSGEPKMSFNQWKPKMPETSFVTSTSNATATFLQSSEATLHGEKSMMPITISSSSENSSDTDSFISQGDVTVEEDEDEHGSLRLCEIDRQNKCIVCQNPIALTECASPQLVNILEHLHEDITAEDLDMSVSSGDIEIGGIEDEVREFGAKRPSHSNQLSLGRLASLMNVPVKAILTLHNKETEKSASLQDADSVAANLCNRCFKLATKADSLDKQLRSCCTLLKQVSQPHLPPDESLKTACAPTPTNCNLMSSQRSNVDIPDGNAKINSACKDTQTENAEFIMPVHETCTTYNGITAITGDSLQAEAVFINPNSMQLCSETSSFILNPEEFNAETLRLENVSTLDFGTGTPTIILLTDAIVSQPPPKVVQPTVLEETESTIASPQSQDASRPENQMSSDLSADLQDRARMTISETSCKLICEKCGISATSNKAFEKHMLKHTGDYSIRCDHCGKGFPSNASLTVHKRSHTKEKPFSCDFCGKSFTTNSNLTAHKRSCSKTVENIKKKPPNGTTESAKHVERRFKERTNAKVNAVMHTCEEPDCNKKFHKRSEYQKHLLTHTGIRPFKCKTCSAAFATKGNLGAHMATHSNDKRFQCSSCDKGFNRKHALQIHENRHKGIRPYSCEVCKKDFFDPGNLQNHKKIHKTED